ncbi:MAG: type VI secretion protein IcmF/TssM N-terminal domain-containing protein [Nannocystaceae bacterium]
MPITDDLAAIATSAPVLWILLAVLGVALLVLMIVLLVFLVRRRRVAKARPERVRAGIEREWEQAVLGDMRRSERLEAGRGALARTIPPRRWVVLGAPGHGKTALLHGLLGASDAASRAADRPAFVLDRGHLTYVEVPWSLASTPEQRRRRYWLFDRGRRAQAGDLPFHGIALVIDALALIDGDDRAVLLASDLARASRELITDHAVDVPVAVVLTHLDRLPGFSEIFAAAGALDGAWGLELGRGAAPHREAIREAFRGHADWLAEALLPALHRLDGGERRGELLGFLRGYAALEAPLVRLVEALGAHGPLRLRGLYFTGQRSDAPAPGFREELLDAIFPRFAEEAARPRPIRRRRAALTWASAAVAASLAGVTHLALEAARARASIHIADTLRAVETLDPPDLATPGELEALVDRSADWSQFADQRLFSAFGQIPAETIADALDALLLAAVREVILRPTLEDLRRGLGEFVDDPSEVDASTYFARVRELDRYLRLTAAAGLDPCAARPIEAAELTGVEVDDLAQVLAAIRARGGRQDPGLPRDQALVDAVRSRLDDVADARVIGWLADELETNGSTPGFDARAVTSARIFTAGDHALPSAYTAAGWRRMHPKIDALTRSAACWSTAEGALARRLHAAYGQRYLDRWHDLLHGLRVRRPRDLDDAHALVDALIDARRPALSALQAAIREHTQGLVQGDATLDQLQAGILAATRGATAIDRAEAESAAAIAEYFRPLAEAPGIDEYNARLAGIRKQLDAVRDDPEQKPALRGAVQQAIADTREALAAAPAGVWHETLSGLLLEPLEAIAELLDADDGDRLREAWCAKIARPLRSTLAGHYPWDPSARDEVALRDLDHLLNPRSGLVLDFLSNELAPWVTLEGSKILSRPQGRATRLHLTPEALAFFEAALRASDALYVDDALQVDLSLTLACTPRIHRVGLTVEGHDIVYTCASDTTHAVTWPAKEEPHGAWLEVHGRGGVIERRARRGEWGLWRLLEADSAGLREVGDAVEVRIDLGASGLGELPLVVRPVASHRPLLDGEGGVLAPLRDPALFAPLRLFREQGGCGDVR